MELKQLNFTKYINYIIVAYAFLLPISRAGITIMSISMILLWFMQGEFKKKFLMLKNNKIVISLVLFMLFCSLSLLWTRTEALLPGTQEIFKTLRLVFLPMIVIATTLKKEYISKVVTAFLLGMFISEILSYGIFFGLWTLKHGSPSDPTPFMHHLDYSTFLTFTSLLLLNRFLGSENWKLKLFYFVYFLFVTSNLFINGGRTGQLAFALSIFIVGFVNIKNKVLAFLLMLILVMSVLYTAYAVSPVFQNRYDYSIQELTNLKYDATNQYHGSFGSRVATWIISIDIIKDNPLLGTGIRSAIIELNEYAENSKDSLQNRFILGDFHNEYIQVITQTGIIGLILYLMIWYNIFKLNIANKSLSNLRYIFISVFMIASCVELIFHNQFPMSLFALFVGVFLHLNINDLKKGVSI